LAFSIEQLRDPAGATSAGITKEKEEVVAVLTGDGGRGNGNSPYELTSREN
jgi:hypothetical protein